MKKWISLMLVGVIAFSMLAGCSKGTDNSSGSTGGNSSNGEFANKDLNIAIFQGGFGADYWNEVVKLFEAKYPGVKVKMNINPKIGEIIKPQIIAGNTPDFISLTDTEPSGLINSMVREKMLLDITDVFQDKIPGREEIMKDVMVPGMLESTKFTPYKDGKVYLAPFNYGPMGFIYNKALFEAKGWKIPETWDDFFALGKELDKQENYLVNADGSKTKRALFTYQGIYPGYLEEILFPAIANVAGTEAIDKIGNFEEGSFNNPKVVKVLDMFQKIAKDKLLMNGTVALNHTQAQTDMMMGKSLFIVNGNWMEGEMKDSPREKGFEFGLMAPPVFNKGDQKYVLTSYDQFSIPAKAKNPELAKAFLKFLYSDESVKLFAKHANGVYATTYAKDLAKPLITPGVYNSYDVMKTAKAMMVNWAPIPKGSKIVVNKEIFDNNITPIMNGEMTTKQWAENVEKAFAQIRKDKAAAGE